MGGACAKADESDKTTEHTETANIQKHSSLTIKVQAARGLRNADWSWVPGKGVSDAYATVSVEGKELLTTKTAMNTLEPVWDTESMLDVSECPPLVITVWDKDFGKPDDKLGVVTLTPDMYSREGFNGELPLEEAGEGIKAYVKLMVKLPYKDYPAGPAVCFDVTINEDTGKKLGIECDAASADMLFVTSLAEGSTVETYNGKSKANDQIKIGQYITHINGQGGDSVEMLKKLEEAQFPVKLSIRRPAVFTVSINKKSKLNLSCRIAPTSLCITAVKSGPLQDWNTKHPEKAIKADDRLVAVNRKRGTGSEIQTLASANGSLQLIFARPAEDSSWHWWPF